MEPSQLLSASQCTYVASDGILTQEQHNLKGSHSKVERKELAEMIEDNINQSFGNQWGKFTKSVAIRFATLKKQLQELEKRTLSNLKKEKIKYVLNSGDQAIINAAQEIMDTTKDYINVRCCDVNEVYKLAQTSAPLIGYETLKEIEGQTMDGIEKGLLEMVHLNDSASSQCSFEDSRVQSRIQSNYFPLRITPIELIDTMLPTARFNVDIRVISIIKRFILNKKSKVIFFGGDETGCAEFVLNDHPLISKNNSVLAFGCKTYVFKNTKQIQTCVEVEASKNQNPKRYVNCQNNISDVREERQKTKIKRKQIKYDSYCRKYSEDYQPKYKCKDIKKIASLKPDDENINFIAEIIKFDSQSHSYLQCVAGDDTGFVNVNFSLCYAAQINEQQTFQIQNADVSLYDNRITVFVERYSKVKKSDQHFKMLNLTCNVSSSIWQEKVQKENLKDRENVEETYGYEGDEDFDESNLQ